MACDAARARFMEGIIGAATTPTTISLQEGPLQSGKQLHSLFQYTPLWQTKAAPGWRETPDRSSFTASSPSEAPAQSTFAAASTLSTTPLAALSFAFIRSFATSHSDFGGAAGSAPAATRAAPIQTRNNSGTARADRPRAVISVRQRACGEPGRTRPRRPEERPDNNGVRKLSRPAISLSSLLDLPSTDVALLSRATGRHSAVRATSHAARPPKKKKRQLRHQPWLPSNKQSKLGTYVAKVKAKAEEMIGKRTRGRGGPRSGAEGRGREVSQGAGRRAMGNAPRKGRKWAGGRRLNRALQWQSSAPRPRPRQGAGSAPCPAPPPPPPRWA